MSEHTYSEPRSNGKGFGDHVVLSGDSGGHLVTVHNSGSHPLTVTAGCGVDLIGRAASALSTAMLGAVAMMGSDIDDSPVPLQGITYGGYAITRATGGQRFKRHRCQRNAGTEGSARGMRLRAAREVMVARAQLDPKTKVVNRMTNAERTDWHRMGKPNIDWVLAEKFSRDRDYRVAL